MKLGYAIPNDIHIRASANMGFIVKVGCGDFVAADLKSLIVDLTEYMKEPDYWEKEYNKLPGRDGDEVERETDGHSETRG